LLLPASTDVLFFAVYFNVIELHSEHVFEFNWVPGYIAFEFLFVVVAHGQIGFESIGLCLGIGEIKGKKVALEDFLVDDLVKHWLDPFFSECRICHTDDCFKVAASENCLLLFDTSEFLVLNHDLSSRPRVTGA